MKTLRNIMLVISLGVAVTSCKKPQDATPEQMTAGVWKVEGVYSNQQQLPPQAYGVDSKLHLDRNESYLFNNPSGIATAGTWVADETSLTLTPKGETAVKYEIISLTAEKMHVVTTFSTFLGNSVEVRYLMQRESN